MLFPPPIEHDSLWSSEIKLFEEVEEGELTHSSFTSIM